MTVGEAIARGMARLAAAGIDEARREARLLTALALGVDPAIVLGYPERALDESARRRLEALLTRREAREPFSRIRGSREFWSLPFLLSPDTLDPRPDSETLVETALELVDDRAKPLRLLDFGTGSGCLLLALLHELPRASGIGVDCSFGAVETARRNAARLGLADRAGFFVGDWDGAIDGRADVILANPPYIASEEINCLAPEVARFEPRVALDGGSDGLDGYRSLSIAVKRLLASGGFALFEVGAGQAGDVAGLMTKAGLQRRAVRRDLGGIDRCVVVAQ